MSIKVTSLILKGEFIMNLSLTEVVQGILDMEEGLKPTMLGIGPMSKTLIKAAFSLAKEKDFPLMFIASRNQVDSKELGGGYVCNWDQSSFSQDIDQIANQMGFEGLYFKCRDHGGPWQRDNERNQHLPEKTAMNLAKKSYLEDLLNGFDLLHIDPTKDPFIVGKVIDIEDVLRRTVELIEYVEYERKSRSLPQIAYEVGTEETNGGLTSRDTYEQFIQRLSYLLGQKSLPMPLFIVGQTGTLTRLTENVGIFNPENAKLLAGIAKKYRVGLKEHNGDYLPENILLQHPYLGITAANVAPEFGTTETRAYLELIRAEDQIFQRGKIKEKSRLDQVIKEESVRTERWRKWMVDNRSKLSVEEVLMDMDMVAEITEIGGHYTFDSDSVKLEIQKLYQNLREAGIDGESFVINSLKKALDRYVECFNLGGLTTKIMEKNQAVTV
jgi:D-tagatose-1,6-bisphosphate aldolase subunit GatZ/KbaZ